MVVVGPRGAQVGEEHVGGGLLREHSVKVVGVEVVGVDVRVAEAPSPQLLSHFVARRRLAGPGAPGEDYHLDVHCSKGEARGVLRRVFALAWLERTAMTTGTQSSEYPRRIHLIGHV